MELTQRQPVRELTMKLSYFRDAGSCLLFGFSAFSLSPGLLHSSLFRGSSGRPVEKPEAEALADYSAPDSLRSCT